MILDERTEFADNADFANETGTANVGDIIDMGIAGRDPGNGSPLFLVVTVDTAADGGGGAAATVAFQVVSDSTSTIATDGTQTIHFLTKPHVAADLTQGKIFVYALPVEGLTYERYLALQLVTGTEGEDTLACSAFLTVDPHGWKAYPQGSVAG